METLAHITTAIHQVVDISTTMISFQQRLAVLAKTTVRQTMKMRMINAKTTILTQIIAGTAVVSTNTMKITAEFLTLTNSLLMRLAVTVQARVLRTLLAKTCKTEQLTRMAIIAIGILIIQEAVEVMMILTSLLLSNAVPVEEELSPITLIHALMTTQLPIKTGSHATTTPSFPNLVVNMTTMIS